MNMVRKPVCVLLSTLLCVGSAQAMAEEAAATLMEVAGTVFVNQGKVYEAAQAGMTLAPNARILTKDGGSAVVVYNPGCAAQTPPPARLGANAVFIVKPPAACHRGATAQQKSAPVNVAASGATGGGAAAAGTGLIGGLGAWLGGLSTAQLVALGVGTTAVVVGGTVGGIAASGGFSSSNPPAPISPTSP